MANSVAETVVALKDVIENTIAFEAGRNDREGAWPEKSIQALKKIGLMGLTISTDLGGMGLGPSGFASVVEQIAEADASTAMIYLMHVCATEVIKQSPLADRDALLKSIARGEHLSTLAFSERGSRSHFWAPTSQEVVQDGKRKMNCDKSFVTSAGQADSYIVSIRAASAKGPTDSTLYYVPSGEDGISVAGVWDGLGLRANASAPMRFDSLVSPDARVSEDGGGFTLMLSVVLPWFQLGSAAVSNGIARGALDLSAKHLGTARLEHLGETLGSFPTLRARLAAARVSLDASRALTAETARSIENPSADTMLLVLEAKACAGENALSVTDAAMRMCGGAAFSRQVPVERYFRDARAAAVMAPTTDVLYDFIGKALLGMPLF